MTPPRPVLRGTVRTAIGGRDVTVPVCQCGELLIGTPGVEGMRCRRVKDCGAWYSKRDIEAAMVAPQQPSATQDAA